MLKFRVISPSLKLKNVLHIAGYNNKSDNKISVMWRTFHC